jgi:hypothetical protein
MIGFQELHPPLLLISDSLCPKNATGVGNASRYPVSKSRSQNLKASGVGRVYLIPEQRVLSKIWVDCICLLIAFSKSGGEPYFYKVLLRLILLHRGSVTY